MNTSAVLPMMLRLGRLIDRTLQPLVDARRVVTAIREVPWFLRSFREYSQQSSDRLRVLDLYPQLGDRRSLAGTARGDYFHQDLWAARKVFQSGVPEHIDVASRVDGFVAHCAVFTKVIYVDVRPLPSDIRNIETRSGHLGRLPFEDGSVTSLSCLHVVEHVGLGRYGDPIDPQGTLKALADLQRVLAPKGNLYLGLPIGRARVCFNAHRITSPDQVMSAMNELELADFAAVDGKGSLVEDGQPDAYREVEYACGLFHFLRP
jgi:SAM-dependent methyltransferase